MQITSPIMHKLIMISMISKIRATYMQQMYLANHLSNGEIIQSHNQLTVRN